MPCSALKPSNGTLDVPVTNISKRARSSSLRSFTTSQNHRTCGADVVYPVYSVLFFKSSMSISGVPDMSSSSSDGLRMEMISCGTMSLNPSVNAAICSLIALVILCAATRLTYSSLLSSVTLTSLPSGIKSTTVSIPK